MPPLNLTSSYSGQISETALFDKLATTIRDIDFYRAYQDGSLRISSMSYLGRLIRVLRERSTLTQSDLAALAGVGRRFISELESGKPSVQFDHVAKVCEAVGVNLFAKFKADNGKK